MTPSSAPETTRASRVKHMKVRVLAGHISFEEDAHELGWDVETLERSLEGIGVRLTSRRVLPCDCEPCKG